MTTLTPPQLHILQHSLGCDKYGRGTRGWPQQDEHDGRHGFYRNHYVCDPTPDLTALVSAGYMRAFPPRDLSGGMYTYTVTREGLLAMLEQESASSQPDPCATALPRLSQFRGE